MSSSKDSSKKSAAKPQVKVPKTAHSKGESAEPKKKPAIVLPAPKAAAGETRRKTGESRGETSSQSSGETRR